jgi:hypothetical protein
MNNNKKALYNALSKVQKMLDESPYIFPRYEIQFSYDEFTLYVGKEFLDWSILEKMKGCTDPHGVSWRVGVDTNHKLYIKLIK